MRTNSRSLPSIAIFGDGAQTSIFVRRLFPLPRKSLHASTTLLDHHIQHVRVNHATLRPNKKEKSFIGPREAEFLRKAIFNRSTHKLRSSSSQWWVDREKLTNKLFVWIEKNSACSKQIVEGNWAEEKSCFYHKKKYKKNPLSRN